MYGRHIREKYTQMGRVSNCIENATSGKTICRGADKSLAFPIFLFATQPKEFFLDGLKKLEQRSHKCVELRGNI
jgi:hypothetical protein